jgi:hypothetical protein
MKIESTDVQIAKLEMNAGDTLVVSVEQPLTMKQVADNDKAHDASMEQRSCNACTWTGLRGETVMLGAVGPLCPECRETTDGC